MSSFLYWPYDEVSLSHSATSEEVVVKAPWLEARITAPAENKAPIDLLINKLKTQTLIPEDITLVNWFFGNLEKYPFSYILPSRKPSEALDKHEVVDVSLVNGNLEDVLKASGGTDVEAVLQNTSRRKFEWDLDSALSFARVGEQIHPESLFSVVRRYHLLDLLQNDKGKEAFSYVESLPQNEFAKAAALIVRQNHFVTQQCNSSLTPAIEIAQSAKPQVEEFIHAERGHDRLLAASLSAMDENYEQIPVSSQTVALMGLLKFAASRNFLAFAFAVDFFERSSYESSDPLAQLLTKGGFSAAAKQINRHMEINDVGEHENVAQSFLASMAPCDRNYAIEALHIAEAVSLVMNSVTSSAVKLYRDNA